MAYTPGNNSYVQNSTGAWVPVGFASGDSGMPIGTVNGLVGSRPDGALNVHMDPTTLLFDTFETIDTTNTWTLSGTVPPTGANGNVSGSPGTAANATSIARSQPTFQPGTSAYLQAALLVQIEAAVLTGSTRWWGLGVPTASPTTTTPIINGTIFEVRAADGLLYGSVYSGGALTQSVALTRPTDGTIHRYQILYKGSRVYFNIDNVEVGTLPFPNPTVGALPSTFGAVNGGAVLGTAPVLTLSLVGVGDTALNEIRLSDGTYPWRRARVGASGDLSMSLTSPAAAAVNIFASLNPYGSQRVTVEPTTVFFDPFDGNVIDTNRWTASGTQVPTQTNGQATFAPTVGASVANNSLLVSVPTFLSPGIGFLTFSCTVTLEAAQTNAVNTHRFWGRGQTTAFAYATPVTDGVGFEVDGATGALQCVVYVGGTKYVLNSSTAANISSSIPGAGGTGTALPTGAVGSNYGRVLTWQGGQHRYGIFVRSDGIYWYVEGQEVPVAALSYLAPNVQGAPIRIHDITNNAGTSLAHTFTVGAYAVNDTTSQNHTLSDPTYQWRRAQVSSAGALSVNLASSASATASVSGTIAAAASVTHTNVGSSGNATVVLVGGVTTNATFVFEGSLDGTNWFSMDATRADGTGVDIATPPITLAAGNVRAWNVLLTATTQFRLRNTGGTITTAPTVTIAPGGTLMDFSPVTRDFLSGSGQRTIFTAQVINAVPSATETLLSVTPYRAGVAGTAATSQAVTVGRTLRIQSMAVGFIGSATATAGAVTARLRYLNGTTLVASPIAESVSINAPAIASNRAGFNVAFGSDGFELPSGYSFGITLVGIATGNADIVVKGYEFA